MRSRSYSTHTTSSTPTPDTPTAPAPKPARSRRTSGRGTPSSRRRARLITDARPADEEHTLVLHSASPEALYRAEKARRAANVDSAAMAEAKRMYDEAVAETAKKRAGMRTTVVSAKRVG